ncbi:DUF4132 domain-containing protein [Massilia genomosp. 1]|uniref:DUF4132 domain-containing protein n=1 Tax=Massilia genomosp. 1 TaxID=2609280 RepID=A0ABX0MSX7_9BURK|nr:DUF4132 domain-containing protein [Massilia genomosp. 1]NHZ63715.1 DUF4132 domain-containing protein [Massilia genomosp. 1]
MRVMPPSASIAPWLAAGALADMPPELAAHALPSRRHPGPPFCATSRERWVLFLTRMRENCTLQAGGDCAHQPVVIDTIERLAKRRQLGTPETDAVLLAMEKINEKNRPASEGCPFLDVLVADKGLPYAFDIMLRAQRICLEPVAGPDKNGHEVHANSGGARQFYGITDLALRAHLAHAPQQVWEQCVRMARDAAKELHTSTRPLLAALLPDAPELANELALTLQPETDDKGRAQWCGNYAWLIVYASSPEARRALRLWPRDEALRDDSFHQSPRAVATALQDRGTDAVDALKDGVRHAQTVQALACIGTPEAIMTLVQGHCALPPGYLGDAGRRWPDATMAALSQLIARDHCGPERARQLLAGVVAIHAHRVPALRPWIAAPAWKVLSVAAAQYITMRDCAVTSELPAVLAAPPWRGKLPAFWTPLVWTRPLLAAGGKALPDDAMDALGAMLRFPDPDGVHAGVTQLKQACTPDSLADFAWELFRAWTEDGARGKEIWAFHALGLLGNDESARRLTRLLRAWPGQGLHARAVIGLDVLARIGSDIALMLLNGVAQKLKFKPLQDRAREKIAQIADLRGLTREELQDRLAPDLGLDEQGTLLLDFGPRQFHAGFDETLTPFVRAADGTRSADLPKPKKSDDADLATAAVKRFKLLKKDAYTIAGQQVLRLELAMCAQRRWPVQVFYDCVVRHPLVRHLAQRLVWGVYDAAGGRLQACFRVTPEGALSDAADDAFTLPQGDGAVVGIPHALHLAPADANAFARLFADYELLQPFVQIGRDTHILDEGEEKRHALGRWYGEVVPTGSLLGLLEQGWRRGPMQDGGALLEIARDLGGGYAAALDFAPGILAGMPGENAQQTLGSVVIWRPGQDGTRDSAPLSSLDAAVVSELIGDMARLCA